MPDVAHSLHEVLDYKGNVAEDLMLTFEVFVGQYYRQGAEKHQCCKIFIIQLILDSNKNFFKATLMHIPYMKFLII